MFWIWNLNGVNLTVLCRTTQNGSLSLSGIASLIIFAIDFRMRYTSINILFYLSYWSNRRFRSEKRTSYTHLVSGRSFVEQESKNNIMTVNKQNIDRLIFSIKSITKNRCSLSDSDYRMLNDVISELEKLKRKKRKVGKNNIETISKIVEQLLKFFTIGYEALKVLSILKESGHF